MLDSYYSYGTEFYGITQHAVLTPLTERCFLSIWQASEIFKGSLICGTGVANTGKTNIARVNWIWKCGKLHQMNSTFNVIEFVTFIL